VTVGDGSTADRLELADWRRRVANLYAEVRALALDDPETGHLHWRETRDRLLRTHPQSPLPPDRRASYRSRYWPYDHSLRFEVAVHRAPAPEPGASPLQLPNSGADVLSFTRIGEVLVPLPEGERRLALFWMAGYAGGLFLPFRDATNGTETYAAGRYLIDGAKSADLGGDPERGTLVLDFNFAYQPSCAFDPRWACPLAPPENVLDVPIRAGERVA
jgi:uncharacterized protein (DUF1684 family)